MTSEKQTIRVQKWVTLLGVFLLCVKFLAYFLTHSVAILTDALESIVNVVAGLIGWYSLYIAYKPRDTDHPYGHGKAEFLSAAIEGTLISLAAVFIVIEAVNTLLNPRPLKELDYGIILIGFSGIVNFIAGKIAIKTGKQNRSMAIAATGRHLVSDAYSTLGLLVGLGVLFITKVAWVDSLVAMLIAVIIFVTGYKIVRQSVAGIMDEADPGLLTKMVTVLNQNRRTNWIDLHNLRIIKYGKSLHVDCHITLPWYFNIHEGHAEIDALTTVIRENFGEAMEIFVHTDGCLEFSCRICRKENCIVRQHRFQKTIEWDVDNIFTDKKHALSESV
ncbi:MAG: cation diffusion facilitator family transporter [Chitinophagaceae bacterium]